MARGKTHNKQSVRTISIVCTLLFAGFSFLYLYAFQGEMMRMVQHLLSGGRTSYHVLLFSLLITVGLTMLGLVLARFISLPGRFKALVWIPSYAVLGWLTDVSLSFIEPSSHSVGFLPFLLLALLFIGCVVLLSQVQEPRVDNSSFQTIAWPNMLCVVVGMAFTGWVGNTNRTLHHELRVERLAIDGDYEKVLQIGADDPNPTRCIMYLRAYALSRQGVLGDKLFRYPNNLGSESLLPAPIDSLRPANMPSRLRGYLGGFPIHDMNATNFLKYMAGDTVVAEPLKDYLLCAFLLDRNLPDFVDSLITYYGPKDSTLVAAPVSDAKKGSGTKKKEKEPVHFSSLPRHFAEALLLYSRLNEKPIAVLDDEDILQNYLDFSTYYHDTPDSVERETLCRRFYEETYWFYYYFR